MTPEFEPKFEVKATGHVFAEFVGPKNAESMGNLFDWLKRNKWAGALQINFTGQGGVNSVVFAEKPKRLREIPEDTP